MLRKPNISSALAIACISTLGVKYSYADIVMFGDDNVQSFTSIENPLGSNRWEVEITPINGGAYVARLDATSSTDVITSLTLNGTGGGLDFAFIFVHDIGDEGDRSRLASIENIVSGNPAELEINLEVIRLDGTLGSSSSPDIDVSGCDIVDIGGDWNLNLFIDDLTGSNNDTSQIIVDGDFSGQLIQGNGSIGDVDIAGNMEAGPGLPTIWARDAIESVTVQGNVTAARIGSNNLGAAFLGNSDVGLIDVAGNLESSINLEMNSLQTLIVDGDFDTGLELLSPQASDSLYSIGGSVTASSSIDLPTSGLSGQIIVNAANSSGAWQGDVTVGGTTALGVDYTELPSAIGGGAVGLVPFSIHDDACSPANGSSTVYPSDAPPTEATIEYYGPVDLVEVTGSFDSYYMVEARLNNGDPSCPWEEVTSDFGKSVMEVSADRRIVITPEEGAFKLVYEYRFTPMEFLVRCANVAGLPDVSTEQYIIALDSDLIADLDGDGTVGSADLGELLAAWGQSCVRPDLEGNGVVSSEDLGILLASWNSPNPPPVMSGPGVSQVGEAVPAGASDPETSQAVSQGGNPVITHFGFDSIEEYILWIDALDEEELFEHLGDLLAFIQTLE